MILQQFGRIETEQGTAQAMLCIDQDRPSELMVHWWGDDIASRACLFEASNVGDEISLKPGPIFYANPDGGLYMPQKITDEEITFRDSMTATIRSVDGYCVGEWRLPEKSSQEIRFAPLFDRNLRIDAEECNSWREFKDWMETARFEYGCSLFRGHGSNQHSLRTTLSRAGRNRVDRYCNSELASFAARAEALLGIRLNMLDASDYATCLGLAQHHGLPTPMLDWTASPYVAAFFAFSAAVENPGQYQDGHKVRVYAIAREFVANSSPPVVNVPRALPYMNFLAVAPRLNPRLQAQQGHFLVTNLDNLEGYIRMMEGNTGKRIAYAADVPMTWAVNALEDLAFMGLTAATLFPGLDGVARAIRHQMSFKYQGF